MCKIFPESETVPSWGRSGSNGFTQVSYLHVSGHIIGDNSEKVVGVGLLEVPQDGEVAIFPEQRLVARLISRDIVASFLSFIRHESIKPKLINHSINFSIHDRHYLTFFLVFADIYRDYP
jgi:hypothetical protein